MLCSGQSIIQSCQGGKMELQKCVQDGIFLDNQTKIGIRYFPLNFIFPPLVLNASKKKKNRPMGDVSVGLIDNISSCCLASQNV